MRLRLKNSSLFCLLAGVSALLIAGCSSTPTKIDSGKVQAQTFQFVQIKPKPTASFAAPELPIHNVVQEAITDSMTRRNVRRVQAGADVTVGYLIITGNNASTTMISDYFEYGQNAHELLEEAHGKYSSAKSPNYFQAGTLLIDIVDSKSGKVLKRGHATRALLTNATAEKQAQRVREVVEEILTKLKFPA